MESVWKLGRGGGTPARSGDALKAVLLAQRGVEPEQASRFFEPDYERDIHDPLALAGVEAAMERLHRAAKRGERVLIFGDYDADGITGVAVLVSTLRELGLNVAPFLPHRIEDGYGLDLECLKRLVDEFDLLISVDCGISNVEEVEWLNTQGKDVIIVDHHTVPEILPPALAIVHPQLGEYPFPHLSGSGVAWKLASALLRDDRFGKNGDPDREKWLLDLCCLGTVADMVPMVGENRAIVRFGFEVLRRSRRPGVRLLVDQARRGEQAIDTELISYRMAPLLNAAGRMDHAQPALDLLLASRQDRALELVKQLRRYNVQRRTVSQKVQAEAEAVLVQDSPVAFAYSEHWPAGVVGLVAGRLSEKLARPAVVVGGGGTYAVGSARAPDGMNIMDILTSGREYMLKMGGHARAAGFSVSHDKVAVLKSVLEGCSAAGELKRQACERQADAVVGLGALGWDTVEMLDQFQPYGEGNARPTLVARQVSLVDWRPVGKKQDHAKMSFRVGDDLMDGIGFGLAKDPRLEAIRGGGDVDLLFYLERNEYMGRRALQFNVEDIAPAGTVRIEEIKE